MTQYIFVVTLAPRKNEIVETYCYNCCWQLLLAAATLSLKKDLTGGTGWGRTSMGIILVNSDPVTRCWYHIGLIITGCHHNIFYDINLLLNVVLSSKTGHKWWPTKQGEIEERDISFSELYLHLHFSLLRLPLYGKFWMRTSPHVLISNSEYIFWIHLIECKNNPRLFESPPIKRWKQLNFGWLAVSHTMQKW